MQPIRFDLPAGDTVVVNATADELLALSHAPADVARAEAAALGRAVEAEMRRRVAAAWAGKRASAQSYWTALVTKGGLTADESADRDALARGDVWEQAMLDAAKALAARGDLDAARVDAAWPTIPADLAALIAEPFAL